MKIKDKKETTKYRKSKSFKIVGWILLIIGVLVFITHIIPFINWNAKKSNYTLEYVYSELGTLYYEVDNERVYIQNIYNTNNEKITLNIPNSETVIMYIDKNNINDGIYFDLDNTLDRSMLNPTIVIFVTLFLIAGGLTSILTYKEANGKEHKVQSMFPVFIFLIILGIGLVSSQVYNAINYSSLKGKNNVTVATIYSEMYNKGQPSNKYKFGGYDSYKPVAYYFVDGNKYIYVNNDYEKGILSDNLGNTFELYYDEQNPNEAVKKENPINILVLVVGIGLIVLFSAPFVTLMRNKKGES